MITATVNGQSLNLPLDFSFDLMRESQLTKHDSIKGDCIPSITFPDTERNRAVLMNPTLFELMRNGVKEFPYFELISDGFDIIRGTLVLNNGFSGFVRGTVGNISAQNADKRITDYDLPVDQEFQNKASYSPDTDDYCAPELVNIDFFREITRTANLPITGTENFLDQTILQAYHRSASYGVNIKTGEGTVYVPTDNLSPYPDYLPTYTKTAVVSPFIYLFFAIKKLSPSSNQSGEFPQKRTARVCSMTGISGFNSNI